VKSLHSKSKSKNLYFFSVLKEKFTKYDGGTSLDIGFDHFCSILQETIFQKHVRNATSEIITNKLIFSSSFFA